MHKSSGADSKCWTCIHVRRSPSLSCGGKKNPKLEQLPNQQYGALLKKNKKKTLHRSAQQHPKAWTYCTPQVLSVNLVDTPMVSLSKSSISLFLSYHSQVFISVFNLKIPGDFLLELLYSQDYKSLSFDLPRF